MNHSICSNAALRRAARRLGQLYDDLLAPSGLRATQYSLLNQIARSGEPSMGELAETMVMDRSALGHTLAPLTSAGLVALVTDAHDRRSKRVVLTDAGRVRLEAARVMWREAQARFERAFDPGDAVAFRDVLDRVSSGAFAARFMTGPGSPPSGAGLGEPGQS
jgi:DNA-binding MarR family transcriptional regulator